MASADGSHARKLEAARKKILRGMDSEKVRKRVAKPKSKRPRKRG